jgi:hypothetical protein
MRHRAILVLSGVAVLALALGFVGGALASNMGFKLNYGVVNAVNRLLLGSGVSLGLTKKLPDEVELAVNLDLANPSPRNSNMGFKLNLVSVPQAGLEAQAPGGTLYTLFLQDGEDRVLVGNTDPPVLIQRTPDGLSVMAYDMFIEIESAGGGITIGGGPIAGEWNFSPDGETTYTDPSGAVHSNPFPFTAQ